MNQFAERYFGYLQNNDDFFIEYYNSLIKNENRAIALKRFPQGVLAIIITNDENELIDSKEAIDYLNSKGEAYNLKKVVLANDNYTHGQFDGIKKLVFNERSGKSIYCDSGCEPLAQIAIAVYDYNNAPRATSTNNKYRSVVTISLIAINVIMFIISAILSRSVIDIDARVLLIMGGKYGPLISNGQIWRLITCNFLHGGIIHLAFNMYALYSLGDQIEILYGKTKYIIIYMLSGIGSSLLSYFLSPNTLSIGASGAIFGLLGALLVSAIKERGRFQRGAITNLVVVIALNLYIGLTASNIDNYGHIGGLVVGVIAALLMYKKK